MNWVLGGIILVAVGIVLHRVLRIGPKATGRAGVLAPLGAEREAVYQPIAMEVETQAAILGISLNDAFEERDAGHHDIAWRLVRLSVGEWDRLAEILGSLLKTLAKHLPSARGVVPIHGIVAHRFRSRSMTDFVRIHELLDQVVFGSGLRFQLHLRVLRRGAETLTAEFRRTYRYGERTEDRPEELWTRLDHYFHDFDLVAKEALLAFRSFLVCLPPTSLASFAAHLEGVVTRGVRSTSAPVNR